MSTATLPQAMTMIDSTLFTLASAMRIQFTHEPAAVRAVDRAVEILQASLAYEFDGTELRVLSFSRSTSGIWHVTDGSYCSCESGRRPWCRHRALFRLLLAQMAMVEPLHLKAKIIEQCVPVNAPGDFLDSIDDGAFDEYGDIAPAQPVRRQFAA
jgi:hypothetical protein